jgi:hypothetical protein
VSTFDPYHELNVTRDSSSEDIKRSYYRLCKAHHPDPLMPIWRQELMDEGLEGDQLEAKIAQKTAAAVKKMQRLTAAYQNLKGRQDTWVEEDEGPASTQAWTGKMDWSDPEFLKSFAEYLERRLNEDLNIQRAAQAAYKAALPKAPFWWESIPKHMLGMGIWMVITTALCILLIRSNPAGSFEHVFFIMMGVYLSRYTAAAGQKQFFFHAQNITPLWFATIAMTMYMIFGLMIVRGGFDIFLGPLLILLAPLASLVWFQNAIFEPQPVTLRGMAIVAALVVSIAFLVQPIELQTWLGAWLITTYAFTRHQ